MRTTLLLGKRRLTKFLVEISLFCISRKPRHQKVEWRRWVSAALKKSPQSVEYCLEWRLGAKVISAIQRHIHHFSFPRQRWDSIMLYTSENNLLRINPFGASVVGIKICISCKWVNREDATGWDVYEEARKGGAIIASRTNPEQLANNVEFFLNQLKERGIVASVWSNDSV